MLMLLNFNSGSCWKKFWRWGGEKREEKKPLKRSEKKGLYKTKNCRFAEDFHPCTWLKIFFKWFSLLDLAILSQFKRDFFIFCKTIYGNLSQVHSRKYTSTLVNILSIFIKYVKKISKKGHFSYHKGHFISLYMQSDSEISDKN